jgi:NADPH2:quinone reductase
MNVHNIEVHPAMKAAWYTEQGAPSAVFKTGDMPDPTPGKGEVKVRIRASGANPTDTYTRGGTRRRGMPFERIIPHQDGAGVIEAVGEGVAKSRINERVWLYMAQWQRPYGTAAQYCVLPWDCAVRMPDNLGFTEGASLGVPWLTAHYAVHCDGPVAGKTVLVHGGTGAVGFYAVQIAKLAGARVITTVGSPEKAKIAREAGADETIDFRSEDVGARLDALTGGRLADRIIDPQFAKNAALYPKQLAKKGIIVVYGAGGAEGSIAASWGIQSQPTIKFFIMYELPPEWYARIAADFTTLQQAGKLKHLPVREFALADIAKAHEAVEKGNSGTRMIVKID